MLPYWRSLSRRIWMQGSSPCCWSPTQVTGRNSVVPWVTIRTWWSGCLNSHDCWLYCHWLLRCFDHTGPLLSFLSVTISVPQVTRVWTVPTGLGVWRSSVWSTACGSMWRGQSAPSAALLSRRELDKICTVYKTHCKNRGGKWLSVRACIVYCHW